MICAHRASEGTRVQNVTVTADGPDTLVSWQHPGALAGLDYRYAVAVDGDLVGIAPVGARSYVIRTPSSNTSIEVIVIKPSVRRVPDLHGDPHGRNVWITWHPSTDEDLAKYDIYYQETLIGSNTVTVLHDIDQAPPTTGSGTGRISLHGTYDGVITNASCSVIIESNGAYVNLGGVTSVVREFVGNGQQQVLADGIVCTFHDARSTYHNGDTFEFVVGPAASYSYHGNLSDGEWSYFQVWAVDRAGNETATNHLDVTIVGRPSPPTVTLTGVNHGAGEIDFDVAIPDPNTTARLYTNYNSIFGTIESDIIEEHWFAEIEAGSGVWPFYYTVDGVYKFWFRTVDATTGVESDESVIFTVDTTDLVGDLQLNVPTNVSAVAVAGGEIELLWSYALADGTDLTEFHLYVHTDPDAPTWSSPVVVSADPDSYNPVQRLTATLGTFSAETWFTVRASDGSVETPNTDMVSAVPDADPPVIDPDIVVVPN